MYWNSLVNKAFISEYWADAANIDPAVLESLFIASNELCVAYAPDLAVDATIPERYKIAEILQARHIWSQANGGNREEVNADGFAVATYPLVFAARDLLRPKSSPLSRLGR